MWDFLVSKPKHYTSEDVHGAVIASTLAILERIKVNVEKASLPVNVSKEKALLESLGLTCSKNMQVIKEAEAKINVHNTIIEENIKIAKIMDEMYKAFGTNTFYIPMKDFTAILDKYNLAVGRLEDYKGTIPEANIAEIAKAKKMIDKIQDNEKVIHYDRPTVIRHRKAETIWDDKIMGYRTRHVTEEEPTFEYSRMSNLYPTLYFNLESWYRITGVRPDYDKDSYKRFPMIRPNEVNRWAHQVDFEKHTLLIAAPVQEMNTLYEISKRIVTDDPIVFSTVGNGVIIYSMWGDEGNDEVLRKYQELNKFIAENVNLGTITESEETLPI
jgi:hypothetical protein